MKAIKIILLPIVIPVSFIVCGVFGIVATLKLWFNKEGRDAILNFNLKSHFNG